MKRRFKPIMTSSYLKGRLEISYLGYSLVVAFCLLFYDLLYLASNKLNIQKNYLNYDFLKLGCLFVLPKVYVTIK